MKRHRCLSIATSVLPQNSCVPPKIVVQPISQQITDGQSVTFSAVFSGSPTLKYQWQRNGLNISGAIYSTLSIIYANAINDAGSYTVIGYNDCGSVQSAVALLVINGSGSFISMLQIIVGNDRGTPYFDPEDGDAQYVNTNLNGRTYVVFRMGVGALVWGYDIQTISGGGFEYINGQVFSEGETYTIFVIS